MREGKRVYDPITDTWSTGWWVAVYRGKCIMQWLPVWKN